MSQWMPPSDEPLILNHTEVGAKKRAGDVKSMIVTRAYTPRLDGTEDISKGADQRLACDVLDVLITHYYGYAWAVVAESRQGFVAFSIPDLMGPTLKAFVNLRTDDPKGNQKLISHLGGNLLERMGLPRGAYDEAAYQNALKSRDKFDFRDVK